MEGAAEITFSAMQGTAVPCSPCHCLAKPGCERRSTPRIIFPMHGDALPGTLWHSHAWPSIAFRCVALLGTPRKLFCEADPCYARPCTPARGMAVHTTARITFSGHGLARLSAAIPCVAMQRMAVRGLVRHSNPRSNAGNVVENVIQNLPRRPSS
jgi:hypothetical protein